MSKGAENSNKDRANFLRRLPDAFQSFLIEVAGISRFGSRYFKDLIRPPYEWREILRQCYQIGNKSLLLVGVTSFIMGMVLTLQTEPTLVQFGAEAYLPSMVAISVIRELGPMIAALITAGKVGSGIGAEIGSMKVTEQIDAMAASGINDYNFLVVTRISATTLMLPLLVFYADALALCGSYAAISMNYNMNPSLFIGSSVGTVIFSDFIPPTIKSFFFGFAIGLTGCYMGYNSGRNTAAVGRAANRSVVVASFLIFLIDLIGVQIKFLMV